MRVNVLLQHGAQGDPEVVPPAVEGEYAATQRPASERAQLQQQTVQITFFPTRILMENDPS